MSGVALRRVVSELSRGARGKILTSSTWNAVQSKRYLPVCTVDTSLKSLPPNFTRDFLNLVATTLNKPKKLVSVTVRPGVELVRGETDQPAVSAQIWSIGVFDEERNPGYSEKFIKFITSKLDVSADSVTLVFHPIEKKDAGHLLYSQ